MKGGESKILYLCSIQVKIPFHCHILRRGWGLKKSPPLIFICPLQVKILLKCPFPVSDASSNTFKRSYFLGRGEHEKAPSPTPPSFPILGDNFCKVYVYIIDLLDLDRIQNFLSTRNPFIFHKNFIRTDG